MAVAVAATAAWSSADWPAASVAAICWSGSSASTRPLSDRAQVGASGQAGEHLPVVLGQVLVQPGKPPGDRGGDLRVLVAEGDLLEQVLQALGRLAFQRLHGLGKRGVHDTDRVDDDEPILGLGVVGDRLELGVVDDPDATAEHLLEVGPALDAPHEDQAFQRLDVGAGRDHVDRDDDPGVHRVAERLKQVLGLAVARAVGDLGGELVALAEDLADDLHDVVGVGVVLGEDQRLGDGPPAGEQLGEQLVLERLDDRADLVLRDDRAVELRGGVLDRLIDRVPADLPGLAVAVPGELPGLDGGPGLGDRGLDLVDGEVHVDAVGDRHVVGVLHHQVLAEEPEGLLGRGGGQADQVGVEVLQDLTPQAVDGPVALVDDDHVERVGRQGRVVADLDRLRDRQLVDRVLVDLLVQLRLALQDGEDALDGGDADPRRSRRWCCASGAGRCTRRGTSAASPGS